MPFFCSRFDTQLVVYRSAGAGSLTGFSSQYVDNIHPATKKTIRGFQFDEARWRSDAEENNAFIEPTLWDPYLSNVADEFQIGVGDNDDLLVEDILVQSEGREGPSNNVWLPVIRHGYYYGGQDEFYLFSDDALTVSPELNRLWVSSTTTISGANYIDLQFVPKIGVPILARSFTWDSDQGFYRVDELARRVLDFTGKFVDGEELPTRVGDEILWDNLSLGMQEFVIDYVTDSGSPRAIFNQQVVQPVGRELVTFSGFAADELEVMELVGSTTEQDYQEHHLRFAPVDKTAPLQIIVDNGAIATECTVVSQFTVGGSNEVMIDWDLGIVRFGTLAIGGRPLVGLNIRAYYHKTIALEYEPENSRDYAINTGTDINPVRRWTADGFVLIRQRSEDPASLLLAAELPELSSNYFGPLYIGNSFCRLSATVKTKNDEPIEGQEIFFELLAGPPDVSFSTRSNTSAISNPDGVALTLLNPPRRIDQMGGVTDNVLVSGSTSQLFLTNYLPPGDDESLFLFQIHTTDNILGIPKTDLLSFYESYLQEQEVDNTQGQGPRINISLGSLGDYSWIIGAYQDFIKWEILHREFHNLATPITYDAGNSEDLRIGKKTVIAVLDATAINPHTGTTPAFIPLQPSSYQITDSGTFINFDQILPSPGGLYKGYLVAGPTRATVRAYTVNQRNGQIVYSNSIDILLDIPDSSKGLFYIDAVNTMSSGLLGNAYNWDQRNLELESVNITTSGLLPVGWRIRSPNITIASALDSITFLDINPLSAPANIVAHEFEVD